ncbi:oligopeptide transport system permease protein [Jatrophihabitans endophyticus]|uniref:Oligopeptide transport system permease protein n=1 Tax=Jatrophihabitans endophyticus TaxID=1206085 RepID=A0A1M5EKK3_9ACTN|nr:oligopeptide transport system permease protein [Jatrophihabitans endophyticus]
MAVAEGVTAAGGDGERRAELARSARRRLLRRPGFVVSVAIVLLMVAIAVVPQAFAGWFGHGDPRACALGDSTLGPRSGHPFGFDKQGCDIYANVLYGTRDSIGIGLLASLFGFVVAVVLGSVAAFYLGWIDAVVSRVADVFFGFPFLLGALVLLTSLRSHSVPTVSATLALFTWPTLTRLMRASMLGAKEHDYVLAARSLGASDWRLIRRHLLPNALAPVVVISTLNVGAVIAAEATLTFLGVGLQQPAISWGLQLSNAQSDFQVHPHLLVFPALFLSVTVFSFIVLGDALEDVLDPSRDEH